MNTCRIEQDDVVIDLGSAPGDFGALAIRFGAKKIYCFDAKIDSGLMETARLNGDRIEIIPRYVSNYEEDGIFTTIDQFSQTIAPEKVSFIKMDIEGAEIKALSGAKKVIASHRPKMAICVYHDYSHLRRIKNIIQTIDSRYQFETLGPVLYCTPKKIL
jgi:predicted rRNA methylase YqxC with S4 and FtsJ domains